MSTKNPRLNVVLEPALFMAVKRLAEKDGVSLSLKARDLIQRALEYCEDVFWVKEAERREKTFSKRAALSHKQAWS
ncbi:MAG: antitoxin, RHH family protein [Candidatus Omnitrophota bacterium]